MAVSEYVIYVEAGEPRQVWCDGCMTSGRLDTRMYGLAESGPIQLGTFIHCETCGSGWACRYCPTVLPTDGVAVFEHLRDNHDEARAGG